mgnify:CR=1 FL=1
MEIINSIFPLVYGYLFFCIFKDNDLKIKSTKQMIINIKSDFNKQSTQDLQIQLVDNNLKKINQNIYYENRYLTFIIPLNVLGILIFYIYFDGIILFLMSAITLFIVISYAAVKKNYLKSYRKLENLT